MKSMFHKDHVLDMKARVEKLTLNSVSRWGKFNVQQMVCHLLDQMEFALGKKTSVLELVKGPPMFIRNFVRLYLPFPKGKIQTNPMMLTTQPGDWEKDKVRLLELMDEFMESEKKEKWGFHPFFGALTGMEWARLAWRHMNHHLSQFGV